MILKHSVFQDLLLLCTSDEPAIITLTAINPSESGLLSVSTFPSSPFFAAIIRAVTSDSTVKLLRTGDTAARYPAVELVDAWQGSIEKLAFRCQFRCLEAIKWDLQDETSIPLEAGSLSVLIIYRTIQAQGKAPSVIDHPKTPAFRVLIAQKKTIRV